MTRYYKPEDVTLVKDGQGNLLAYGVPGDDELNDKARKAIDVLAKQPDDDGDDRCPTCKSVNPNKQYSVLNDDGRVEYCQDVWHRQRFEGEILPCAGVPNYTCKYPRAH